MPGIVLLGPQRHTQLLVEAMSMLGVTGPCAAITAGWQEREAEVDELNQVVGQQTSNLLLHERAEAVFREDTLFREAHRAHQEQLKALQDIYRNRLQDLQKSVGRMLTMSHKRPQLYQVEINHAMDLIRQLDEHHYDRLAQLNQEFEQRWQPSERSDIQKHREELRDIIDPCDCIFISGGHVAVLLNRIRLFGLEDIMAQKAIVAWSAGAMILARRIILFHDSPPQGFGHAEVFEGGLNLIGNIIPLPHARTRLKLGDNQRISLFAKRFNKEKCITLDENSGLVLEEGNIVKSRSNTFRLLEKGTLEALEATWH
jgi:peptidase E